MGHWAESVGLPALAVFHWKSHPLEGEPPEPASLHQFLVQAAFALMKHRPLKTSSTIARAPFQMQRWPEQLFQLAASRIAKGSALQLVPLAAPALVVEVAPESTERAVALKRMDSPMSTGGTDWSVALDSSAGQKRASG